ncbi:MAG: putative acyltransferase [Acidobacteriaceae bacterium]|nr:putative acyltransferase [Acidobacteriaceae bacterium]
MAVFFHHLCFTDLSPEQWGPAVKVLYRLSEYGDRGVDLFFVLSGFLITSLLIKDKASTAYYQDFYWKRTLRILPLYIVCLVALALFVPASRPEVLLSALFVVNFAQLFHVAVHGPFWTLAIEEQFYILWPTVVRRRSVEQLVRWAIVIAGAAIVLRFAAAWLGHYNYHLTFLRCDGLAAGALLACWFEHRHNTSAARRREGKLMLLAAALGAACLFARFFTTETLRGIAYDAALFQTGTTFIAASLVAFLITNSGRPMLALFRSRVLLFFGLISYAMYMVHTYVLMAFTSIRGPIAGGDTRALAIRFFIVLIVTIALSLLTRYLIELPAISLRRFVLKKPAPPAEIEAPLLAD